MHIWLQGFAYSATVDWQIFVGSGIVALTIAFATINYQAIRAAVASPVKSLKAE